MKTPDAYQKRIAHITEYLELGKKLTGIVSQQKEEELLRFSMSGLEQCAQVCEAGLQGMLTIQETEQASRAIIAEYALLRGVDRKTARPLLENEIANAGEEAKTHFRNARLYRIAYGLVFPFLPKLAQEYKRKCQLHSELNQVKTHIHQNFKSISKTQESTLRMVYELEHREARTHESLRAQGFPEYLAREMIERPEILYLAIIDTLKNKHAPYL